MTGMQVFGLLIGALMLGCMILAAGIAVATLKDGRERRQAAREGRRYRALVDEDRKRDVRLSEDPDLRGAGLAQATAEYITTHPEEWNQSVWGERLSCGTTACVAGTAVLIAGLAEWEGVGLYANDPERSVGEVAADAFGLDYYNDAADVWDLFHGSWHREPDDDGEEGQSGNPLLPLPGRLKAMWHKVASLFPEGAIKIPAEYR